MLNNLSRRLTTFAFCIFTFTGIAQNYNWKVELKVNPVHSFFDNTPLFDAGSKKGLKLRSFYIFGDKFKESRSIAVTKSFGKNRLQMSYESYSNEYALVESQIFEPFTVYRGFHDFNLNYIRNYAMVSNQKVSFSWGAGIRYRRGREMRTYRIGGVESSSEYYYLNDLGINLLHQVDYNLTDRLQLFTQFNLMSTVVQGDENSKVLFDNSTLDPNYRPQRFNFSLGFGVSYNFNL